jgi:serine/threonine-protein kinase PpkA
MRVSILISTIVFVLSSFAAGQVAKDECIYTEDGVPMKVILKEDAPIHDAPNANSGSKPGRVFDWFYVLPPEQGGQEKLKDGFYQVAKGATFTEQEGWVHKANIVEWNHRQAIGFKGNPDERERVIFFRDFDDLKKYMLETKDSKNPRPISQEPDYVGSGFSLMPVLDLRLMNINGTETEVYEVAYLHGNGGGESTGGGIPSNKNTGGMSGEDFRDKIGADFVFVIDSTGSMTPWIEKIKEVVSKVYSNILHDYPNVEGDVRFGLVAYRDKMATAEGDRKIEYLTKVFCTLEQGKDLQAFLQRVSNLKPATVGSEDWPEDVFAGMKIAIEKMDWNRIAERHLILIGDASAQDAVGQLGSSGSTYKNFYKLTLDGVCAMAQGSGVTIETAQSNIAVHALHIIDNAPPGDVQKCEGQFRKLAAGRDVPGIYKQYDSSMLNQFVSDLLGDEHIKSVLRRIAYMKDPNQKSPDIVRAATSKGGLLNVPLLKNLIITTLEQENGVRAQHTGFTSGWACRVDIRDNFQLESHVLVTRGRMQTFVTVLDKIVQVLDKARDPGSGDVTKALQQLQIIATLVSYEEQITGDHQLADLLSWILALPIKSDIFNVSIFKLRSWTQEQYADWVNRVRSTQQIIQFSLDDRARWRSIGSSTSEVDKKAFIKVSDLP